MEEKIKPDLLLQAQENFDGKLSLRSKGVILLRQKSLTTKIFSLILLLNHNEQSFFWLRAVSFNRLKFYVIEHYAGLLLLPLVKPENRLAPLTIRFIL